MFVVKHRALALSASFASADDTCARGEYLDEMRG